jgi:hypothetical protein
VALSPGIKWQGHEADHSPPSYIAVVKNGGVIPPLPHMPYGIIHKYIIKYRDNFTLYFFYVSEKMLFPRQKILYGYSI